MVVTSQTKSALSRNIEKILHQAISPVTSNFQMVHIMEDAATKFLSQHLNTDMMASEDGLREANGPVLKSQKSSHFSFIRFYNTTGRSVDVIWINYEGRRVKYQSIKPCEFLDVNTFVGHPWIFCDSESGERMVVQLRDVFRPTAWDVDAPRVWPPKRKVINITIPVYSLQKCCLHAIKRFVPSDNIHKLDVTEILRDEIYEIFRLSRAVKPTRTIGRVLLENQSLSSDT